MPKVIRITATKEDGEVLDSVSVEIPDDHKTIGIRSYDTSISPSGLDIETLSIGVQ